ncbi:hypothetical protein AB0H76_12745 [Nocardia sp. NPDC050712]|uniref:hypothetical protein n=1 Tax=Nocardia sp. NPDC050712 TaxID=3155518 RepID=UPI0033F564D0
MAHARIPLAAIQVRWCARDSMFVAWSDRCPDLEHADPWSSLAAVEGLLDAIGRHPARLAPPRVPAHPETGRPCDVHHRGETARGT